MSGHVSRGSAGEYQADERASFKESKGISEISILHVNVCKHTLNEDNVYKKIMYKKSFQCDK